MKEKTLNGAINFRSAHACHSECCFLFMPPFMRMKCWLGDQEFFQLSQGLGKIILSKKEYLCDYFIIPLFLDNR